MNYKIGVVGSEDAVFPFSTLGFATFSPKKTSEIRRQIQLLAKEGYGIIYISEDYLAKVPEVLSQYDQDIVPVILPIPAVADTGRQSFGKERIQKMVEQAVGTNIL